MLSCPWQLWASEPGELVDDGLRRLRGIDLMRAGPSQERLDLGQVAQESSRWAGVFPYGFVARFAIRPRRTLAGALSRTTASKRS